eukprot:1456437-Rhodomonas_salina.1
MGWGGDPRPLFTFCLGLYRQTRQTHAMRVWAKRRSSGTTSRAVRRQWESQTRLCASQVLRNGPGRAAGEGSMLCVSACEGEEREASQGDLALQGAVFGGVTQSHMAV